jgi:hypothetical protein
VSTGEGEWKGGKRKVGTPLMENKIRRKAFLHGGKALREGNRTGSYVEFATLAAAARRRRFGMGESVLTGGGMHNSGRERK